MTFVPRCVGLITLCLSLTAVASDGQEELWKTIAACPSIKSAHCAPLENHLKQDSTALKTIIAGFRSPDQNRRSTASKLMQRSELGSAAKRCQALIDAEKTTPDSIRGELYGALGRLKHGCAVPILAAVVVNAHTDARNRIYAANALGYFPRKSLIEPLSKALQDPMMRVQSAAARSLGDIGDKSAVPALINRMMTVITAPSVRIECAKALAKLDDDTAIAPLAIILHHRLPTVRSAATRALGALGKETVVPLLIQRLHDPGIQEALVGTLATLADERGIDALGVLARNESAPKTTRLQCLQGLGHWQSSLVHKNIHSLLNHTDPDIVIAAATALGQARTRESIATLLPLTTSAHAEISKTAVWALQNITGKKLGTDPEAWKRAYPTVDHSGLKTR